MKPAGYSSNGLKRWLVFAAFLFSAKTNAQELFINTEPASTIPKGVLGVRLFDESWNEQGPLSSVIRNMDALRLMYGLTSKLSIYATGTVSNHHTKDLPFTELTHTHSVSGPNTNYYLGIPYPYQYNGIDLYAKYRFLAVDGQNTHFRMAVYGESSDVDVAHDEAEPHLLDDNKGIGAGLITTFLNKHFAASLTTGYIVSGTYSETGYFQNYMLGQVPTNLELTYGRAYVYDLSLGYLLFPRKYNSYSQTNVNLYVEFIGESWSNANVTEDSLGTRVTLVSSKTTPSTTPMRSPLLLAGNYIDIYPGVQVIFNSNLRVDFSVGFPFIDKSYTNFYPVFELGVQRYFFL